MLLEGLCSCMEVLTQTCLQAFHDLLQESKPSIVRFSPLGSPTLLQRFFPLGTPTCSTDGISPTRTGKPTGSPHLNPRVGEPLVVFFCRIPSIFRYWDVPYSETALLTGYPPHERKSLLLGLSHIVGTRLSAG